MERSKIRIEKYNWNVEIFYAVTCYQTDWILHTLASIDCPQQIQKRVEKNLSERNIDTGFTYSNKKIGKSVLVVGLHSSPDQFLNSFEHELRHLVDDIADTYRLNAGGEEVAYLTGDLNSTLWEDIHRFICCQCKKHFYKLKRQNLMCNSKTPCGACRCAEKEKERREHIAELLKMLEPELPDHIFEQVKFELQLLI